MPFISSSSFNRMSSSSSIESAAASSSPAIRSGLASNSSRPLMATLPASMSFFLPSCSFSLASRFFSFQAKNSSSVTGVPCFKFLLSTSRRSPISGLSSSSSGSALFLTLKTKSGGKACLYLQLVPPLGHSQNQPYFLLSTASIKYLHTWQTL